MIHALKLLSSPRGKASLSARLATALVLMLVAATSPARSDEIITTHRLSAALAAEAATEAVASCAKQGFRVSAAVVDVDGLTQATLRGDGFTRPHSNWPMTRPIPWSPSARPTTTIASAPW